MKYSRVGYKPLSVRSQIRPSVLGLGIHGEKGPNPHPCAGADKRAISYVLWRNLEGKNSITNGYDT